MEIILSISLLIAWFWCSAWEIILSNSLLFFHYVLNLVSLMYSYLYYYLKFTAILVMYREFQLIKQCSSAKGLYNAFKAIIACFKKDKYNCLDKGKRALNKLVSTFLFSNYNWEKVAFYWKKDKKKSISVINQIQSDSYLVVCRLICSKYRIIDYVPKDGKITERVTIKITLSLIFFVEI